MNAATRQQPNLRRPALVAGLSLILMALAASFSYGYVHERIVADGDAGAMLHRLQTMSSLFKAEIFGWLVILILDLAVAWALYLFLEPVDRGLALLSTCLRLMYAAFLGMGIMQLLTALQLTNGSDIAASWQPGQLQAQVALSLASFKMVWSIGLIVFGAHLLILGRLVLKAGHIPRIWGYLLLAAGVGYMAIHLGETFFASGAGVLAILPYIFALPMYAGELGFGLWLALRGGRTFRRLVSPVANALTDGPAS